MDVTSNYDHVILNIDQSNQPNFRRLQKPLQAFLRKIPGGIK